MPSRLSRAFGGDPGVRLIRGVGALALIASLAFLGWFALVDHMKLDGFCYENTRPGWAIALGLAGAAISAAGLLLTLRPHSPAPFLLLAALAVLAIAGLGPAVELGPQVDTVLCS